MVMVEKLIFAYPSYYLWSHKIKPVVNQIQSVVSY